MAFAKIDEALKMYYEECDRYDYMDNDDDDGNKVGKFIAYCEDNGLEEEDLAEELQGEAKDCMYLEFDPNFPFLSKMKNKSESEKQAAIFKIIKHCHKHGLPPIKMRRTKTKNASSSILVDGYCRQIHKTIQFNSNLLQRIPQIILNRITKYFTSKYTLTGPLDLKHDLSTKDVQYAEKLISGMYHYHSKLPDTADYRPLAIGYHHNRFPFLLYLMESFDRDRITHGQKTGQDMHSKIDWWIKTNHYFTKYLHEEQEDEELILKIEKSIKFYIRKWMNPMRIMIGKNQMQRNFIKDDIYQIMEYVLATQKFVQQLITKQKYMTPFQCEFTIAVRDVDRIELQEPCIPDLGTDDDAEDFKPEPYVHYDRIGHFERIVSENELLYEKDVIKDRTKIIEKLWSAYNRFAKKVEKDRKKNKFPNTWGDWKDPEELKSYGPFPDKRRFCCFIDRREHYHKTRFEKRQRPMGRMMMGMMGHRGMMDMDMNDMAAMMGRGRGRGRGDMSNLMGMMGPMYEWVRIDDRITRNLNEDDITYWIPDDSFLPPNNGKEDKIILPEAYFEIFCTSMIPELRIYDENREEKHMVSERVSGISAVDGALFTLSFQVERYDEVRVYLWWHAQCIRLHADDLWKVLPWLFRQEDKWKNNAKFKTDTEFHKRIQQEFTIKDRYYRYFYENISVFSQEDDLK